MTTWPPGPPPHHPVAPPSGSAARLWVGFLVLLGAAVAAVTASVVQVPWASGQLLSSRATELNAGDLVNRGPGALPFAVLAGIAGLTIAAVFAVPALPAGRVGRTVVTAVLVLVLALGTASALADVSDTSPLGEMLVVLSLALFLPVAVLLLLTWRGARRGAAGTALCVAALAVVGTAVALVELVRGTASVGYGVWLTLLLDVVAVGGAGLLVSALARRTPAG